MVGTLQLPLLILRTNSLAVLSLSILIHLYEMLCVANTRFERVQSPHQSVPYMIITVSVIKYPFVITGTKKANPIIITLSKWITPILSYLFLLGMDLMIHE